MTRFARAEGSKACNKRICEEATSWEEMKADLKNSKKKKSIVNSKHEKKSPSKDSLKARKIPAKDFEEKIKLDQDIPSKDSSKTKKRKQPSEEKNEQSFENNSKDFPKEKKKKMSLEEKINDCVVEDGVKFKVFKDGSKKPWFNLPYAESDIMTKYNKFFVKRDMVDKLNQFKKELEEQGLDTKQISNKMLTKERRAHNHLRVELLKNQIKESKPKDDVKVSENAAKKPKIPNSTQYRNPNNTQYRNSNSTQYRNPNDTQYSKNNISKKTFNAPTKTTFDLKYEENDFMTQFEGYWILKQNLEKLEYIQTLKKQRILDERKDGNTSQKLTKEEELIFRRLMKKEKRREGVLLKKQLLERAHIINRQNGKPGRSLPGQNQRVENKVLDVAKFDGISIKREGAERLTQLKEKLVANNCTEVEVSKIILNERRKEERLLKNEKNLFCFMCRSAGHMFSACPQNTDGVEGKVEICFKCGSTEHMSRNCTSNKGAYSYATCFICGEVGHISRECPDNPKGLYPNGGCCNECGSVEHLKRDCPDLQKAFEDSCLKVKAFERGQEIEAFEDDDFPKQEEENVRSKPLKAKRIVFD